ncbi:MAG: hypothetical protein WBA41_03855 [Rivularia sp. (in: cyanobacteria)]
MSYAHANSNNKKPVKQLYFEWEYGGKRGKTYVRLAESQGDTLRER